MFENLKNAFSNAAKSFGEKELKEKDIDDILFQLEISLLESDVATEVIDSIKSDLKEKLIGTKVEKKQMETFVEENLIQSISNLFDSAGNYDILGKISEKKDSSEPFIILFVGINGTGKTTTLAKLAYKLQKSKVSLVIAASDTFRAGAIEQLREHTNRLNLKLVAQNYGSDPAAVARDAVLYAKSHKVDCVLIDTAGRMQTSKNLMDQIAKITNVVKPDMKIFVGDSLAGNDTVNQAREFHEHVKFDASILTKSDADARGGAALSIVKVTSTPILYVGIGQEYEDLKEFDKEVFLQTVFGSSGQEIKDLDEITLEKSEQKVLEPEIENEPQISEVKQEIVKEPEIHEPEPTIEKEPELVQSTEKQETKPETKITSEPTSQPSSDDPFAGIETEDINNYVDLYDVAPPETDEQAIQLAVKIKQWISNGKPKPGEEQEDYKNEEIDKSKKKRSLFGRFKN